MTANDTSSVVAWLADGARSARLSELVLAELCSRLVQTGIPLWRVAVFVRTLHPQIMGRRFILQSGAGVTVSEGSFDVLDTEQFRNSPFVAVVASGKSIRRRLTDNLPDDFPIFRELRTEGVTDYFATPLIFTDGAVHAATWATRHADGFSDAQIASLEAVVTPLARVAEIRALRRTATNLLDTYVGHQAGERILSAEFARHCRVELEHLGAFMAAGFSAPQTAFGLASPSVVKPDADGL